MNSSNYIKWSKEDFCHLMTSVLADHGWFKLHRALILKLGIETAAVLHYLMDFHLRMIHNAKSYGYEWDDGWFYATVDRLEAEVGISSDVQLRILRVLKENGFIELGKRGMPPRRFVRVNTEMVARAILDWTNQSEAESNQSQEAVINDRDSTVINHRGTGDINHRGTTPTLYNTHLNNTHTLLRPKVRSKGAARAARTPRLDLLCSDFDRTAAGQLREVLVLHDSDLIAGKHMVRIDTLTKSISRIRTERSATESQITQMLQWLKVHYGDQFVPKMHKADDLFSNWRRYVEAKQKDNGYSSPTVVQEPKRTKSEKERVCDRCWAEYDCSPSEVTQDQLNDILWAMNIAADKYRVEEL